MKRKFCRLLGINFCFMCLLALGSFAGCGRYSGEKYTQGEDDAIKGLKDDLQYQRNQSYRMGYDHAEGHIQYQKENEAKP